MLARQNPDNIPHFFRPATTKIPLRVTILMKSSVILHVRDKNFF